MSKGSDDLNAQVAKMAQEREEAKLREALEEAKSIEYGELTVVIHQGKVFEVKTTRRKRH